MKISRLIAEALRAMEVHGDLDVVAEMDCDIDANYVITRVAYDDEADVVIVGLE